MFPPQLKMCQCRSKKIIREKDESPQLKSAQVFFSQNAHTDAFLILKLSSTRADFKCLNGVVENMIGFTGDHVLPADRFLTLGHAYCESFLRMHPLCEFHTYESYLELLSNKFVPLLKRMCYELRLTAENVLPDSYTRRKVLRKFFDEYSVDIASHVERISICEEKLRKKYSDLYPLERLTRSFVPFTFIVNVIEQDLLLKGSALRVSSRSPLIMNVLWEGVNTLDADGITNNTTRSIFDFYAECWHNDVQPVHLKTVARLIGLMSKAAQFSENVLLNRQTRADAANSPTTLEKKLGDTGLSPSRAFTGRALNEIENGTRKIRSPAVARKNTIGFIRSTFATVLAASLKHRCSCEGGCEFVGDAISFLSPVWLRLHVTAHLLKQEPTIEAMKLYAERQSLEPTTGQNEDMDVESILRTIFFSAAEETFAETWRRAKCSVREGPLLKRAKLDPVNLSTEDREIDEFMNVLRALKVKRARV